jgi:hypothetical protein
MQISVKKIHQEFEVTSKSAGIEFSVRDESGNHLGDFYIRKTGIVWAPGRVGYKSPKAKKLSWWKLIDLAERNYRA